MSVAETYVTAAYLVFLALVLAYVVIISTKVGRLERELAALSEDDQEHEEKLAA